MSTRAALDNETRSLLALRLVQGLGPRLTRALLERFGGAECVLTATAEELAQVRHLPRPVAERLLATARGSRVDEELELLEKHGVQLAPWSSRAYPAALKTIHDPPALLYIRGTLVEADERAVAVVGSRQCTPYGRKVAERLAGQLARAGYTVISGLARGIDAAAHRGALEAGGRTLAIMAGGLARIYPPEHTELADQVAAQGALITEAAMAVAPLAELFPNRNRIISGMSKGVVIVEAAERSGALITARLAADQGRDVFAVPGPVDSPASAGALQLLKDGAILVRDAEDILSFYGDQGKPPAGPAPAAAAVSPGGTIPPGLPESQERVLRCLEGSTVRADDLVARTRLSVAELSNVLIQLELSGLVRRLPGNCFERRN